METTILALLFSLVAAYGAVCALAPRYSMRLDGTASRQEGVDERGVRIRTAAGVLAVGAGITGAAVLLGPAGVLVTVVAAGAAALWTTGR